MFAAQRVEKIKEIMLEHKNINVAALTELLHVSDVTVRKDLEKLQDEGFLRKTFGGAVLIEQEQGQNQKDEQSLQQLKPEVTITNHAAKAYAAALAAKQVEKGDTIFLGSGVTCYLLSKMLKELKDLTVVTNNVNALNELVPHVAKVFFIGGEIVYQEGMISTSSEKVDDYFKGIYVNKAFTSATGVDLMAGLTVNHSISTFIFRKIQEMASSWTLLVEESKFGKRGIYQIAPLEAPDCMITNNLPDEYKKVFEEKGIKVITK
jgi:DeoR/GlpR family transcriptional regulator of sugar metabolism